MSELDDDRSYDARRVSCHADLAVEIPRPRAVYRAADSASPRDRVHDMGNQTDGFYSNYGEAAAPGETRPNPSTTLTASVETIDNDRAVSSIIGGGIPTD